MSRTKCRCGACRRLKIHRHLLPDETSRRAAASSLPRDLVLRPVDKNIDLCVAQIVGDLDICHRHRLEPRVVEFKSDDLRDLFLQPSANAPDASIFIQSQLADA